MKKYAYFIPLLLAGFLTQAKENISSGKPHPGPQLDSRAASCNPASSQMDLAINAVRARIYNGGDMWWDLQGAPQYEVPAGSGKHSLFASSLWIGGMDIGGNLKVAAQTYRQTGNDFYPGPLDQSANTTVETCDFYDDHYRVTKAEVEEFLETGEPTQNILDWPGDGPNGEMLAPYVDVDGLPGYSPWSGDYPAFDIGGELGCDAKLFGDEAIWWVFNDNGNIHSETGGEAIGLEIRAQAFAFTTNDEINNMTFYKYEVINRSSYDLYDTYFGQWVDPDLGYATDDFVGCDVSRGLGYCYNGDAYDDGANGYGNNPPAVGLDFFEGPFLDPDGIDNPSSESPNGVGYGDGIVDNERIGMAKFIYFNNDFTDYGNPSQAIHFYNYLSGKWKNNEDITYGGNGHEGTTVCNYMFPGNSDPEAFGTNGLPQAEWTEASSGNVPADRRFIQSAGTFTLRAGAVNNVTVGAVWARASTGGPQASIELLKIADDKAQTLFNNCFRIVDGPNAPKMEVVELENELVFNFIETESIESYSEMVKDENDNELEYNFQGYMVYQLADATVSVADLDDPDKARLVFQCDKEDGVTKIVNGYFDPVVSQYNYQLEVDGSDEGIRHSFSIKENEFASGDPGLVNHWPYHFIALSYAYSPEAEFLPFLAGRKNIKVYTGVPHRNEQFNNGFNIQAGYGDGPVVTRLEGRGTGGNDIELTEESVAAILESGSLKTPSYIGGHSPVKIQVIDPLSVPEGDFEIRLTNNTDTASWELTGTLNNGSTITIQSDKNIDVIEEQLIPELGLMVTIAQSPELSTFEDNEIIVTSSIAYEEGQAPYINFLADQEGDSYYNWIRSGSITDGDMIDYGDENQQFEKVVDGTWAPYRLTSADEYGPSFAQYRTLNKIDSLGSIDVVFTPDQTKWTRCPMVELSDVQSLSTSGDEKFDVRTKDSQPTPSGAMPHPAGDEQGFTYFPGYAIDPETGERLYIVLGENSSLAAYNGDDMKFNPTSDLATAGLGSPVIGGMHYIYVLNSAAIKYFGNFSNEGVSAIAESIRDGGASKRKVYTSVGWVSCPMKKEATNWLGYEAKVRIRVNTPYKQGYNSNQAAANPVNNNNPLYRFSTNDIAALRDDQASAQDALEHINVVPNPYYGYSKYENTQLDNTIKFTNLPDQCTIRIFTINGTLIKTIEKDNQEASINWDMKNESSVPIASGMYIIHVHVEGVGDKILKWFGALRPIDLDTF